MRGALPNSEATLLLLDAVQEIKKPIKEKHRNWITNKKNLTGKNKRAALFGINPHPTAFILVNKGSLIMFVFATLIFIAEEPYVIEMHPI